MAGSPVQPWQPASQAVDEFEGTLTLERAAGLDSARGVSSPGTCVDQERFFPKHIPDQSSSRAQIL